LAESHAKKKKKKEMFARSWIVKNRKPNETSQGPEIKQNKDRKKSRGEFGGNFEGKRREK